MLFKFKMLWLEEEKYNKKEKQLTNDYTFGMIRGLKHSL